MKKSEHHIHVSSISVVEWRKRVIGSIKESRSINEKEFHGDAEVVKRYFC